MAKGNRVAIGVYGFLLVTISIMLISSQYPAIFQALLR
jgi:hypothetical protein